MLALAFLSLAVALAASSWTVAYAWTAALPDLLWLQRARQYDAWWDSIEALHLQLDVVLQLDNQDVMALTG